MKFKETGGRTTTYGRLHPEYPSYTINTYFRRPNVGCNFHYSEPRLITPREAMRLQSMPDHWELVFSSQDARNALIGNAVPPLMGHAIAWSVSKSLTAPRDNENLRTPLQMELLRLV
jgi:DNA (cytosine-5)-methyltransferase 1